MAVEHAVNIIQYNDWQFLSVALQPKSALDRLIFRYLDHTQGARCGVVVKVLRYKPAGRGFDSR